MTDPDDKGEREAAVRALAATAQFDRTRGVPLRAGVVDRLQSPPLRRGFELLSQTPFGIAAYGALTVGLLQFASLFMPWYRAYDDADELLSATWSGWTALGSLDVLLCILAALTAVLGFVAVLRGSAPLPWPLHAAIAVYGLALFVSVFWHLVAGDRAVLGPNPLSLDRFHVSARIGLVVSFLAVPLAVLAQAALAVRASNRGEGDGAAVTRPV